MTKSERTRLFILEKTAPLFNSKGFEGTSLADLTNSTGLTKGALYGHFQDKEEMAREAFAYAMDKVREVMRTELVGLSTYKKQLTTVLEFYAKYVFEPPIKGGCPLLNMAIEVDDHHSSMRSMVAKDLMKTVNFIAALLQKGIDAGEFKSSVNPTELAYTFFCSVEGALMFSRVERSEEPMEIIVKHCKSILDQISK